MKLLLLFLLASVQLSMAGELVFAEADRADLLQAVKHARMLTTNREIPPEVIRACREETRDDFALANPDEDFQWSDARSSGLGARPIRRLVWGARVANFCIIHYQKGGFAPRYVVVVTSIVKSNAEARVLWSEYTKKMSFEDFVSALKQRQLKQGDARL